MKRLNKNLWMTTFLEMIITALKRMLASVSLKKSDSSDRHKTEYYWMRTLKTIAPFGLNTKETYWDECWEVHTIMRFCPLVLLVYITAERM